VQAGTVGIVDEGLLIWVASRWKKISRIGFTLAALSGPIERFWPPGNIVAATSKPRSSLCRVKSSSTLSSKGFSKSEPSKR
jgi:hypothetical protein